MLSTMNTHPPSSFRRPARLALPPALLACTLLGPAPAWGAARDIDFVEQLFGATRINAALGHGRLTAGISRWGELTVLRWPGPSYYEHVNHRTAAQKGARELAYYGAQPNEGSFAGLVLTRGGSTTVTWLRDGDWTRTQRYRLDTADTLETIYTSSKHGLTVTGLDVVDPSRDVLARNYVVTLASGSAYDSIGLMYYENFSPTIEKTDFGAMDAYTLDGSRDYALVYHAADDALWHLSAKDRPDTLLAPISGTAPDAAAVASFLAGLGATEGTYLAVGGMGASAGFQCGLDAVDGKGKSGPTDAYADAADGKLSGSRAALRHATGALLLDLGAKGGEATVLIAAGKTVAAARAALTGARKDGFSAIRNTSEKAWSLWLTGVRLPSSTNPVHARVARRALISIRTATDAATGAVVASISTQPPYNLDWPRDGAFINVALDVAGKLDEAGRHNELYAGWQRTEDGQHVLGGGRAPVGSFAMNYYADGRPGGPIPFEIDHVGLVLWSMYMHACYLTTGSARRAYLGRVWPAIDRAADLLATCKDPANGLQCKANEDDETAETQTLHGAAAVIAGLEGAVRAARFLGKTDDAETWLARLTELRRAVDDQLYVSGAGYSATAGESDLDRRGTGQLAWALWPAQVRAQGQVRMRETAALLRERQRPFFEQKNAGGAYQAKGTLSLAMHDSDPGVNDAAGLAVTRKWLDLLVGKVPTPGTGHYGEVVLYTDLDGDGVKEYDNRTAVPHVWEGTLVYLSLMAAYDAKLLRPDHIAPLTEPEATGCRVRPAAGPGPDAARAIAGTATLACLALLILRVRGKRRRG